VFVCSATGGSIKNKFNKKKTVLFFFSSRGFLIRMTNAFYGVE
jgi:hypothetical protein